MRHNDAHHNNSLVQICTQWNLDRNSFIYVSSLPEGTKRHCITAVLPLLLLQCWHFEWMAVQHCPLQTAGRLQEGFSSHCAMAVWVAYFAEVCPDSSWKLGGISLLRGEFTCRTQWAYQHVYTWLIWEGEQGIQLPGHVVRYCVVKGRRTFSSTGLELFWTSGKRSSYSLLLQDLVKTISMLVGPLLEALMAKQQCIALHGQHLCATVHLCATEPLITELLDLWAAEIRTAGDASWGWGGDGPSFAMLRTGKGWMSLHASQQSGKAGCCSLCCLLSLCHDVDCPHESPVMIWADKMFWVQGLHSTSEDVYGLRISFWTLLWYCYMSQCLETTWSLIFNCSFSLLLPQGQNVFVRCAFWHMAVMQTTTECYEHFQWAHGNHGMLCAMPGSWCSGEQHSGRANVEKEAQHCQGMPPA